MKNLIKDLLTRRKSRVGLRDQPFNLSASATAASIQAAIRLAEAGDTKQLFTLYRDSLLGDTHIQSEFGKRKMAVLSQPHAIQPFEKGDKDDEMAAEAVRGMIAHCKEWTDGLITLMDASLWPVTVVEKVFGPAPAPAPGKPRLQYALEKLQPVHPVLLCFREPVRRKLDEPKAPADAPERWESALRIYSTDGDGRINWQSEAAYPADPAMHIVHRGHLLVGQPDNFGGPFRAILFWWFLRSVGREWFARLMERYGSPFPVGKVDASNQEAVTWLQEAFSLSTKIGGLVVDEDTQIDLIQAAVQGGADAHERFQSVCNREISRAIVGQELSSTAQATGLGSGVAKLQGTVRDDIEAFDKLKLGETLRCQLFAHFLTINGLVGRPPKIVWGGTSSEESQALANVIETLNRGGLEPTDEAIPTISERVGFQIQRKAAPAEAAYLPPGQSPIPADNQPEELDADDPSDVDPEDKSDLTDRVKRMLRVDTFSAQRVMSDELGVPTAWLDPVRQALAEMEAKLKDASLSDEDLIKFLEQATQRLPELFAKMDKASLARILESGMGGATLASLREGLARQLKPPGAP